MDMGKTAMDAAQKAYASYGTTDKTEKTTESKDYGKTIGSPKLSEAGQKYYEELKKKYSNMDFILVSEDMKQQAQAQAGSYANPTKPVVLIDEEKIERMATDESFRKQYEGIISGATTTLSQMKQSIESTGASVKGYGVQVKDGGLTSYFAVLKKSSAAQKARIEKKAAEKKAQKKEDAKKAEKDETAERLKGEKKTASEQDTVTIQAGSLEELLTRINDYLMEEKSDTVQTEDELKVGQHIDFRG